MSHTEEVRNLLEHDGALYVLTKATTTVAVVLVNSNELIFSFLCKYSISVMVFALSFAGVDSLPRKFSC